MTLGIIFNCHHAECHYAECNYAEFVEKFFFSFLIKKERKKEREKERKRKYVISKMITFPKLFH
jgi:hypothetical protein